VNVVSVKRLRHNDAIPVIHLYVVIGLSAVGLGSVSHIYTDRDKARQIERATATLGGGRLPTLRFDCIQRVYAPTPHYAMYKRLWLLQQQSLHRRRSVGEDISAAL
jgi:hypothetical protein